MNKQKTFLLVEALFKLTFEFKGERVGRTIVHCYCSNHHILEAISKRLLLLVYYDQHICPKESKEVIPGLWSLELI